MKILQCSTATRAHRAELRRQGIVDAARTLFSERGFHSTGIAQIAAASGVAVGQIYRDFQGKEDIIAAIAERDVGVFLHEDELAGAIARGDRASVRGWIGRLLTIDEPVEDCRLMCEILAEMGRNARIREINHAIEARVHASVTAALTALMPESAGPGAVGRLSDLVMLLSIGLSSRRVAAPGLNVAALSRDLGRIVDGELARLQCRATAGGAPCDPSG